MENLTYRDQLFWGISIDMANGKEVDLCYKHVKEATEKSLDVYSQCEDSKSKINYFTWKEWHCSKVVQKSDLCNKKSSISKDDLIALIESIPSDEITVDGEKILSVFQNYEYIIIYECGRVFLLK